MDDLQSLVAARAEVQRLNARVAQLEQTIARLGSRAASAEAPREPMHSAPGSLAQTLFEHHDLLVLLCDREGLITRVSPACVSALDVDEAELLRCHLVDALVEAGEREPVRRELDAHFGALRRSPPEQPNASSRTGAFRWRSGWHCGRADKRFVAWSASPLWDDEGELVGLVCTGRDQSQCREVEEKLRLSEQLYRTLVDNQSEGLGLVDAQERFVYANPAGDAIFGLPPGGLSGRSLVDFLTPESLAAVLQQTQLRREGHQNQYQLELRRPSGETRMILVSATPYTSEELGFMGTFGIFRDITEARRVEQALSFSEARFRAIAEQLSDCIFLSDDEGLLNYVSPAAEKLFGRSTAEILGNSLSELFRGSQPVFRGFSASTSNLELRLPREDGSRFVVELSASPFVLDERAGWVGVLRDVSERIDAQERLRIMAELLDSAPSSITVHDYQGRFLYANRRSFEIHGFTEEEFMSLRLSELDVPVDAAKIESRLQQIVQHGEACFEVEHFRKDHSTLPLLVWAKRVQWGDQPALLSIATDVSERKRAELERSLLEEQLRVAQKMEAIGRLAGGVAHDFNNLLSVILAYTGFVLAELPEDDLLANDLLEVQRAGERATKLTKQLLAFSRNQVLEPATLDLNPCVQGLEGMLQRMLGPQIELRLENSAEPVFTFADITQVEQVIFNLVVNARDAMPDGGTLSISTANVELDIEAAMGMGVEPGPYTRLSVDDTGCGISRESLPRIFDPFFTTKPQGRGTGLGLAMVYGFVRQSGGCVQVESSVGRGSRFELYLPRLMHPEKPFERVRSALIRITGNETVLVVEDEHAVRNAACRILSAAGYRVLTASNADEAQLVCDAYIEPIHALLTDVLMPGMNGKQLAERLSSKRPQLRVLFMSGHDQGILGEQPSGESEAHFIAKPFQANELTCALRSLLDEQPPELEHHAALE